MRGLSALDTALQLLVARRVSAVLGHLRRGTSSKGAEYVFLGAPRLWAHGALHAAARSFTTDC